MPAKKRQLPSQDLKNYFAAMIKTATLAGTATVKIEASSPKPNYKA